MKNKSIIIIVISFFIFLFLIFYKGLNNSNIYKPSYNENKIIPKFSAYSFFENELINSENIFNQKKFYLLNIWASWCMPCRREMPSLEKLTNKYPEIKVYAINMEKPNKIIARDFFQSIGVASLDIYFDPDFKLVKQFKMRGLPTSILVDKSGKEFGRVIGEVNFMNKDFIELLKRYI